MACKAMPNTKRLCHAVDYNSTLTVKPILNDCDPYVNELITLDQLCRHPDTLIKGGRNASSWMTTVLSVT